jgi:hypothetical protein
VTPHFWVNAEIATASMPSDLVEILEREGAPLTEREEGGGVTLIRFDVQAENAEAAIAHGEDILRRARMDARVTGATSPLQAGA